MGNNFGFQGGGGGSVPVGVVESVTGLNTDNTDPQNPIVEISVDGTTITGDGTPASPLIANVPASVQSVTGLSTDNSDPQNPVVKISVGSSITGDGTPSNPLNSTGVPYSGATQDVNLGSNNLYANNIFDGFTSVVASGTLITLTLTSTPSWLVTGSGGQTIKMPNATTLPKGAVYLFNNNQSSGAILVNNNSNTLIKSVGSGALMLLELINNSTSAGTWDTHFQAPSNVLWTTNTLDLPQSITSATWNGVAIADLRIASATTWNNKVSSVTGLNTDNTNPLNPIVKISVDGTTIQGDGTPASPLITLPINYLVNGVFTNMFGGDPGGNGKDILEFSASVPAATHSSVLPILSKCRIIACGLKWISSTPCPVINLTDSWNVNLYRMNTPSGSTTIDANFTLIGSMGISLTSTDSGTFPVKFSSGLALNLIAGDLIRIAGVETGTIGTTTEECQFSFLVENY
jgi:hypothetical protein